MIEIFPNEYAVDEQSNVYSLKTTHGDLRATPLRMKQRLSKEGYMTVVLHFAGKPKLCLVHRLVALAYIPNPENKPEVNHKDGVKHRNVLSNLEWATKSENAIHGVSLGLRVGSKHALGRLNEDCPNSKPILQLTMQGELVKKWPSMAEAKRNGFSQGNISSVIAGTRISHKGFKWAFA